MKHVLGRSWIGGGSCVAALIHQVGQVEPVGESMILTDQANFSNARELLAHEVVAIDENEVEYGCPRVMEHTTGQAGEHAYRI